MVQDRSDHNTTSLLSTHDLTICAGSRTLVKALNLDIRPGEKLAILGENGSGKTTLLHTLMGLQPASRGTIKVQGRTLQAWTRQALAREIGILFQEMRDDMPASVHETVMLGRLPHLSGWRWESEQDLSRVTAALASMDLLSLAQREIQSLSGGERQRLAIACLLAQNPRLYLLDEPSNHLDISFQIKVLQMLGHTITLQNSAMLMATHDINLAARFSDRILLLQGEGRYLLGVTEAILQDNVLSDVYRCSVHHSDTSHGKVFYVGEPAIDTRHNTASSEGADD